MEDQDLHLLVLNTCHSHHTEDLVLPTSPEGDIPLTSPPRRPLHGASPWPHRWLPCQMLHCTRTLPAKMRGVPWPPMPHPTVLEETCPSFTQSTQKNAIHQALLNSELSSFLKFSWCNLMLLHAVPFFALAWYLTL